MSISYGGDTIQDTDGGVLRPISSVMRNRLINGDFRIDQRNAGASVTPTATGYTLDRWGVQLGGIASKFSVQQNAGAVTPPVGFTNYLGCTSLSAYTVLASDIINIRQLIEGFNVADLCWGTANAKTVTLSFWVRSSLTGTFGGSLRNSDGSRSYPYSYTIASANTWEYKTITITGDTTGTWLTTSGTGLQISFGLGVGSTFSGTAGSWSANNFTNATGATNILGTSGATFYITGVQLEVGSSATGFEYRQYQQELALCQRYYETFTLGADESLTMQAISTSRARGGWQYKVQKRATATNTSSGTFALTTSTSGGAGTATVAFQGGSLDVAAIDATGVSSMVAGNATNAYGGAKLTASAEL